MADTDWRRLDKMHASLTVVYTEQNPSHATSERLSKCVKLPNFHIG